MESPQSSQSARLESWKEIAAHLNRTVRTVQRWEREQGLPVHRLQHNKLASVFAYVEELDRWWENRRVALEATDQEESVRAPELAPDRWRRWIPIGVVALVVMSVGAAWLLNAGRGASIQESDRLYAAGRQRWNQRTPTAFREALVIFRQAIDANPANARAFAGLADTYSLLEAFGVMSRADALPAARDAAMRAVEIGPDLAEPHTSLSFVLWTENDRVAAFREIERAIAIDPRYATAQHWHALYLQDSGRYADAVEAGRRARVIDPTSTIIASDLALMLRNAGRDAEAIALLEGLVASHPRFADANNQLAEMYRLQGRYAAATEQITKAVQNGDSRAATLSRLGYLHARNGDRRHAVAAVERLGLMRDRGEHVPPVAMAEALVAAGDLDSAFTLIERALDAGERWPENVANADVFEELRRDGRWRGLAPRIDTLLSELAREILNRRPTR